MLKSRDISAILSVLSGYKSWYTELQSTTSDLSIHHLHISLDDTPSSELLPVLPQALSFLRQQHIASRNILIHCHSGISRSTSIAIAFLTTYPFSHTFDTALHLISSAHFPADPAPWFLTSLGTFYERTLLTRRSHGNIYVAYEFPTLSACPSPLELGELAASSCVSGDAWSGTDWLQRVCTHARASCKRCNAVIFPVCMAWKQGRGNSIWTLWTTCEVQRERLSCAKCKRKIGVRVEVHVEINVGNELIRKCYRVCEVATRNIDCPFDAPRLTALDCATESAAWQNMQVRELH